MTKNSTVSADVNTIPRRRLSPQRVILAILMISIVFCVAYMGWYRLRETQSSISPTPWFAPYVDVTATPTYTFEQFADNAMQDNVVLSFIVSLISDACTPSWGGVYTFDEASTVLDLDRRIARFRQQGGTIAVSFGGLLNDELAVRCDDSDQLKAAYLAVIDRYDIDTIDFDLEGKGLTDLDALKRRATIIAQIQKERSEQDQPFAVWLTLPVAPQGLTEDGTNAIAHMLASGVDIAGVNVMTMNYGGSRDIHHTMQQASERALIEAHRQLGVLYSQAGIQLNAATLWSKIGATPMIGQNDIVTEIFTLEDSKGLNEFALSRGIVRMSMWSANRDIQCGENYANITIVSDACSGVKQDRFVFADILGAGFDGDISSNAARLTMVSSESIQHPDNPEESPYQIWSESGTYLEGTKVVWRRNVYQAKWWTRGDIPDNPVLQSWQTPWQLIGPVLPGEKPIPQSTLPLGTYPTWVGTAIYEAGQRVLLDGVPYQAKWWTQGDSPAASTSNPDGSPWVMLSQKQIEEILEQSR